jgi:general secretion pathway protein H
MNTRHQQSGFTLIELIVVIVIIGVMVGMSTLALSGRDQADGIRRDADRLRAVISLLQDEAIIQSREYGLQTFDRGYRFFIMDDQQRWIPMTEDKTFRPYTFSDGVTATLVVDGVITPISRLDERGFPEVKTPAAGETADADSAPSIYVLSSGEMSQFEIQLVSTFSATYYKLSGNLLGQLALEFNQQDR